MAPICIGNLGRMTFSRAGAPGAFPSPEMQKPPPVGRGFLAKGSLTITYFHTGIRTIIGVE
ncbi:hypothetical protein, partial [Burkholderia ubonensis]|uniref:hypothetical protein n=1 Tax=Burkholderia ubonensis TaxID=101571 RepID=UPI001E5B29A1